MPSVKEKSEKPIKKETKKTESDVVKEFGIERDHDLPWSEKKVALIDTLKSLKATSETKAVTASQVVERAGGALIARDVRHYGYHAKAGGLVEVATIEGVKGYSFYLTAKGASINAGKALIQQQKEKGAS